MNVRLAFHTVRYLKPGQLLAQVRFRFRRRWLGRFYAHRIARCMAPAQMPSFRLVPKSFPAMETNLKTRTFVFLNHSVQFPRQIEWNDPRQEKLWLYHLHYFDYLLPFIQPGSSNDFESGRKIIQEWIEQNPVGYGNGWEPYPTSLRLINWTFFFTRFSTQLAENPSFQKQFWNSLYRQFLWLEKFLEYHLMANHLLVNLKAMVWGSLLFRDEKRFRRYTQKFSEQLQEQILPDGGHFERSPAYHAAILVDLLDLCNLLSALGSSGIQIPGMQELHAELESVIPKMLEWLHFMTHPDGEIALFGDSALKVAPAPTQILAYFRSVCQQSVTLPNLEVKWLKHSGYVVFTGRNQRLILDVGELGVSYQPGHAHCDLTSFEYAFDGERFIVDTGVGSYLPDERRQKARSILGHNTVVVNGLDQAEIWQAFRMGRRVSPSRVNLEQIHRGVRFSVEYENRLVPARGYWHRRRVEMVEEEFFLIQDAIRTSHPESIESRLHFPPDTEIQLEKGRCWLIREEKKVVLLWNPQQMRAQLHSWFYVPEFGKIRNTRMLVFYPPIETEGTMCYVIAPEQSIQKAEAYLTEHCRNG